jgi:predicted transcriptional regulator
MGRVLLHMSSLKTVELKFLLKLLGCEGYRGKISALTPNSATKAAERDRICEVLGANGTVAYDSQVGSFKLAPAGRTLLSLDTTSLPVTPDELKVLQACQKQKGLMTPGKLSNLPTAVRQDLIRRLAERGMLVITKEVMKEVWLTAQGKQFLLHEFEPSGSYASAASATMLGNYVRFLRQNLGGGSAPLPDSQPSMLLPSAMPVGSQTKPDSQVVLQQIKQLDQLLGSDNYLPICYLREKLQPPLTRDELDNYLYELQRNDQIELSSLHDQGDYSDRQMSAGISQNNGGALFFISVL